MAKSYRAAIVTVSDSVAQGVREDLSGPAVARLLEGAGWTVRSAEVVPDDFNLLRERMEALSSDVDVDVVFTTGGTGLGPRDRTPEATTSVMERSIAGLAELMRREGMKRTPLAALSRGVVGVKAKTVLVNLPGAPEGAEDSLRVVLDILPHAIDVVRGEAAHEEAGAVSEPAAPVEPTPTEEPLVPPAEPEPPSEGAAGEEATPEPGAAVPAEEEPNRETPPEE
jgi:molybdopterin adenylyltransferase